MKLEVEEGKVLEAVGVNSECTAFKEGYGARG